METCRESTILNSPIVAANLRPRTIARDLSVWSLASFEDYMPSIVELSRTKIGSYSRCIEAIEPACWTTGRCGYDRIVGATLDRAEVVHAVFSGRNAGVVTLQTIYDMVLQA